MNTIECIEEIKEKVKSNLQIDSTANYAVLYPISRYNDVDFNEVAKFFKTDEIHSFTQTDKIIITVDSKIISDLN